MECSLCHKSSVNNRHTKLGKWDTETILWVDSVMEGDATKEDLVCRTCKKFIERNKELPTCSRWIKRHDDEVCLCEVVDCTSPSSRTTTCTCTQSQKTLSKSFLYNKIFENYTGNRCDTVSKRHNMRSMLSFV
jgi:hypothetical protein